MKVSFGMLHSSFFLLFLGRGYEEPDLVAFLGHPLDVDIHCFLVSSVDYLL